jgi:fibronectin type 3 domain-containing protein
MRRALVVLVAVVGPGAFALGPAAAVAQTADLPELWLVATGDTVLVQIPDPPPTHYGFVVYRTRLGGERQRLTEQPVQPILEPRAVAAAMGEDLAPLMQAMGADNEVQLARRLRATDFASHVASLLYRGAAISLGRFFADTDVIAGEQYDYRVVFLDVEGGETDEVRSGRVIVDDVGAVPVDDVEVDVRGTQATVQWSYAPYSGDPLDFVVSFDVYRADGPTAPFIRANVQPIVRLDDASLRYVDRTLIARTDVRYRVVTRDLAGRASEPSNVVSVVLEDRTPPSIPGDLITQPGDGVVSLLWGISPELDVAGYLVERSTGLDEPFERLVSVPVPAESPVWTDTTAFGGTQYFYRVIAIDSTGNESTPGNPVSAVPVDLTPPSPPSDITVTVEDRMVTVRWSSSPSADVIGYYVYRGDTEERTRRLMSRPLEDTVFIDSGFADEGLNPGESYVVKVSAVDGGYNESSVVTTIVSVPDDEAPAPPTAVQILNVRGRYVEARWSPSGALDVDRYAVRRYDAIDTTIVDIGIVPATEAHIVRDTLVTPGTRYWYHLVAIDTAGNESAAVTDSLDFRDFDAPAPPRHVTAVADTSGAVDTNGVVVEWERVVDPELRQYRIYRSTTPTGVYQVVGQTTASAEVRSFRDPDGTLDLFYVVRAVDSSGNESRSSPFARVVSR